MSFEDEVDRPPRTNQTLLVIWIAGFLILGAIASCVLFNAVRGAVREFDTFELSPRAIPTGTPRPEDIPVWSGVERLNILLLGIDEREIEQGPWRTDTMILLTIDPATRSAGMLSIPRDLWVPIPGYDVEQKIATAHFIGDVRDYPGGGTALAMATVQQNLGVSVNHYVRLNFTAFEKLIDLIGGIDVYVEETIDDPTFPDCCNGYDPFYIEAGWQHMGGVIALKYARTRHTEFGDFDRAHRQQQVIIAVRDKVKQANLLPTLIGQIGPLVETLGDSVQTDLTLDQLIQLANLGSQIDLENIQKFSIEPYMTLSYLAPTDPPQYVLVPIRDEIRKLRDRFLSTGDNSVADDADDATRLAAEAAVIRVENGTQTVGLASRTGDYLTSLGYEIASFGDAFDGLDVHASTLIFDHGNKPFTAALLANALNLPSSAVRTVAANSDNVDVRIVLGDDFANALGVQLLQTPEPSATPAP